NFLDIANGFEEITITGLENQMRNQFFADYVNFSIAYAKLSAGASKEQLFSEYIEGHATSANNPEYCAFIDAFYGNYFQGQGMGKKDYEILRGVNVKRNPVELDSVLTDHDNWSDGEVRRLAILINLFHANYQVGWDKTGIKATLERVSEAEGFERYTGVAESILSEIAIGQTGSEISDFRFIDYNNEVYTNETFAGKFTYFVFFTSWCRTCIPEFKSLEKLYIKYDRQVEIVLVNLDEDYLTYLDFLQQHPEMEGTIVYGLSEPMVFDVFNIQAVPEAVLMSPEGKLIYDYTRKPSEGVSIQIEKLINRKPGLTRPRVGSKTN
ncbi:MAG: thiol-disulfide isomerase/thioredoxin, partial [Litorivivens sp.]